MAQSRMPAFFNSRATSLSGDAFAVHLRHLASSLPTALDVSTSASMHVHLKFCYSSLPADVRRRVCQVRLGSTTRRSQPRPLQNAVSFKKHYLCIKRYLNTSLFQITWHVGYCYLNLFLHFIALRLIQSAWSFLYALRILFTGNGYLLLDALASVSPAASFFTTALIHRRTAPLFTLRMTSYSNC